MQTVIMAGGEGKRLRPLTCSLPKPLLPLLEKPIIEYILDLLRLHFIDSAVVTTGYLGEKIKAHFPEGKYKGISLGFSYEEFPLGTAGSVKRAVAGKNDDVLVISGDALCDFDLSSAINFHRKRRPAVTIIGKKVEDPREYGLITSDENGRVIGFLEKPDYSKVSGNIANTGVYIISPSVINKIPDGETDFSRDIFPKLLNEGEEIAVYEEQGYWCDIGSIKTYISCQRDILKGRVNCARKNEADGDGNIIKSRISSGVKVIPPVYIGDNVIFGKGVTIESGSVIGSGARVLSGSKVKGGIIGRNVSLGERVTVSGAVADCGAVLKRAASLYEQAVAGESSTIEESSVILPFIKVWPYKTVESMTVQKENVQFNINRRELFSDEGIFGETGIEITPEFLAGIGRSVGSLKKIRKVFIASENEESSYALSLALVSGLLSAGADAYVFPSLSRAEFLWAVENRAPDMGIYLSSGAKLSAEFYHSDSLPISREIERALEDGYLRGEYIIPQFNSFGKLKWEKKDTGYSRSILKLAPDGLFGQKACVCSSDERISEMLKDMLLSMGAEEGGVVYQLTDGGMKLSAYSEETGFVPYEKLISVLCIDLFSRGIDVALPERMPRAIDEIADAYGRKVWRYADLSVGEGGKEARRLANKQPFLRDGAKLLVSLLAFFKRTGLDLKAALRLIPAFAVEIKTVKIPETVATTLSYFSGENKIKTEEGLCIERDIGTVFLKPMKKGREIRIFAESRSIEFSKELAEDVEKILAGNLDRKRKKG